MRIAFYCELEKLKNKLVSVDLEGGNPGIGGTQYLFLLTVKYLNEIYGENYCILLTDTKIDLQGNGIKTKFVNDVKGAIQYCEDNNIEFITINANIVDKINDKSIWKRNVKFLIWAHNTVNRKIQTIVARNDNIHRLVCVSEKQYLNMVDTKCFNKCTYISNMVTGTFLNNASYSNHSRKKVVYVGSIYPQKGVHNLLDIWKYVLKEEPDAILHIIGGSQVWNPNISTGELGITEPEYEKIIKRKLKKISNMNSVKFLGPMGWNDIRDVLKDVRVGIVNPSYYRRDETFCMSAIEISAHGIPIVSRAKGDGLVSTVINGKTGYLESDNRKIASRIITLLKEDGLSEYMGKNAREYAETFNVISVIDSWEKIMGLEKCNVSNKNRKIISKDSMLLLHDKFIRYSYYIISGKAIKKIVKKFL